MPINYQDHDVTRWHADIVSEVMQGSGRKPELWRAIPGVVGTRVTDQLRQGVHMAPIGGKNRDATSCTRDVARRTLLVMRENNTSNRIGERASWVEKTAEAVRRRFNNRRVLGKTGELYSRIETDPNYQIDDAGQQRGETVVLILATHFREDR